METSFIVSALSFPVLILCMWYPTRFEVIPILIIVISFLSQSVAFSPSRCAIKLRATLQSKRECRFGGFHALDSPPPSA